MISPSGSARHFPVQQRERIRRDGTALTDDRSAVLFLAGFALAAAAAYAVLAPFLGPVAASGWVSVSIIGATALAAFIAAYRGAVRVAVLTTVVGLGVASVVLLVIAGRQAPSAELFTITVVLAALAAGRRAAIALMVTATLLLAAVWWWLPDGIDPVAGELIGRRRPIADIELLVFGSLIALWWSRRTERTAREHHRLLGNEQIIETLQQAVASSRAGIAITDANGVLTYANEALLDMWRVADPRAAVGRHVFSFWDEPEVAQAALIGFSEGTVPVAKLRGRRDDGSTFDVEVSGSRVVGPDGSVEGHIGSFVDVSERTIAEEQLQVERERTRAIVESVLDIVVILDAHGTIVFENAAVQRVLGFMPGERVGQSILMHAHPDDMARAGSAMAEIMTDPQKLTRVTMRFRHKQGGWRWLETFGRNLFQVPAIGGILGVGRDVTDQQEMRARLEATDRLETVGRLAGGVAHDFNNLLTAILGNAELAQQLAEADSDVARYLDGVMQAGQRARDLTRKLLAFARREIAQPVVIDLRDRLRDTRDLLHRLLGEHITVDVEGGETPLPVLIDPVQFEQIVLNLAVNARDAMPSGGRFRIRADRGVSAPDPGPYVGVMPEGECIRVIFEDSGLGMPPEVAARVFEPFFTTKELGRGTGLGLSTVYGGVRQAQGAIRVTSRPGEGTTFEIVLPVADGPVAPARAATPTQSSQMSASVLVVEDDPGVRGFMVEVLTSHGCTVREAADGRDGQRVADAHAAEIDVLVTDVVMPHQNGLELARHFRRIKPGAPVLFVTGYSSDPTIEAQAASMNALVLLKPFTIDQLLSHVRRLLDRAQPGA